SIYSEQRHDRVILPEVTRPHIIKWKELLVSTDGVNPDGNSRLIRRVDRYGNILSKGISPTAIRYVLNEVTDDADLPLISPDNLRLSAKKMQNLQINDIF
ncbi:MAG: hypothetical protein AAFR81_26195, partial [Chloroflexota bacterium]